MTFIVGKHLSYYRGEHYIKNLFPTQGELKVVFFSAIKIIQPDFNVPAEMAQAVNQTASEFVKYMQPVQADGLRRHTLQECDGVCDGHRRPGQIGAIGEP